MQFATDAKCVVMFSLFNCFRCFPCSIIFQVDDFITKVSFKNRYNGPKLLDVYIRQKGMSNFSLSLNNKMFQ